MRKQLPVRALSYLKTHMQKKKWRRVVTVLSCIVVFCTTYALILPAITMTQQTHVHTPEDCYEWVLICGQEQAEPAEHVHTDACYQEQAILICGAAEGEGAHLHTQDCFDEAGNAVCGLDESARPRTHGRLLPDGLGARLRAGGICRSTNAARAHGRLL